LRRHLHHVRRSRDGISRHVIKSRRTRKKSQKKLHASMEKLESKEQPFSEREIGTRAGTRTVAPGSSQRKGQKHRPRERRS